MGGVICPCCLLFVDCCLSCVACCVLLVVVVDCFVFVVSRSLFVVPCGLLFEVYRLWLYMLFVVACLFGVHRCLVLFGGGSVLCVVGCCMDLLSSVASVCCFDVCLLCAMCCVLCVV